MMERHESLELSYEKWPLSDVDHLLTKSVTKACGVTHFVWNQEETQLAASLWYPAISGSGSPLRYLGILTAKARENAQPDGDAWPLVFISHGSGGSRFDQYYLAEYLAMQGCAVLTLDHQDLVDECQRWKNLIQRPSHLKSGLAALFEDPHFATRIDFSNLLLIGHSAGAYDVLVAAGCSPDFAREKEFASVIAELSTFDAGDYLLNNVCGVILLAPALSNVFHPAVLSSMAHPVLVLTAELENVKLLGTSSHYVEALPDVAHHVVRGAGHYAFIHDCPPVFHALNPIVSSGDERSRCELHQEIFTHISGFMTQVFRERCKKQLLDRKIGVGHV
ncbi:hypothetical protein RND59_11375 [Vibrio ruber]|uniref:alpha/beta hydrolase family protein n=1 Tax=Vibrio ruber TaxID=184755 RepID=UPI002892A2EC|nr:hypothetical protein [Vibrio ruber]WNJ94732.1 hypothetical protein RND59_11375 [Vibrio ruber]